MPIAGLRGGETGALMRALDWSASPLGPPQTWPGPLRSAANLLLNSKLPMFVAWGPELGFLYNDAYAEILGDKHPAAMGARFEEIWREVWPEISPLVDDALAGRATYREDLPLQVNRSGSQEPAWFTFSYSPVQDDDGQVAGMFCAVVETTARIRSEQRRDFLIGIDERLRDLEDPGEMLQASAGALGEHLGVDRVHWATVDLAGDCFEVRREWRRDGVAALLGVHRLSDFGAPLVAHMAVGGMAAVTDLQADRPAGSEPPGQAFDERLRGALSVPLLRGGRWRAALCVHSLTPRHWREDEQELVREVGERVWTRIERAFAEIRVRKREARLRALVNATADSIYRISPDGREITQMNRTGGLAEAAQDLEAWIDAQVPAEERVEVKAIIAEAVRSRTGFRLEHRARGRDGSTRWLMSRATPLFDARGELIEWFGAATDITEARQARSALEQSAERLSLATEAAEVGFWDFDLRSDTLIWPPRVKQMFGISPDVPVTIADFRAGVHPQDRDRVMTAFARAADPEARTLYDEEYRTIGREDGVVRWVAAKGRGIFDDRGRCVRMIGAAIDVTERKSAEDHLRLMVNELNHRVKNSLATVQAITTQTLRRGAASDEIREALTARLLALARAHDVLTDERWSGAELAEILRQTAQPYVSLDGDSPLVLDGPRVFLQPKTAIALALAFHELATNAAKYGALSAAGGKVLVAWEVAPREGALRLLLRWREVGGPMVSPPTRTGFGARLIQRGLASELQGDVRLDYLPTGLVCTMDALLPEAADAQAPPLLAVAWS
jgi:PAS domain S-box-containing protein